MHCKYLFFLFVCCCLCLSQFSRFCLSFLRSFGRSFFLSISFMFYFLLKNENNVHSPFRIPTKQNLWILYHRKYNHTECTENWIFQGKSVNIFQICFQFNFLIQPENSEKRRIKSVVLFSDFFFCLPFSVS